MAVFGAFDFIVEFIIMIINFFRGKKLFPVYPEDEKAYEILQRAIDKKNMESEQTPPMPQQPIYVQQNYYPQGQPLPPGYQPGAMPPYQQPGAIPPNYQQPGTMPPYQQPGAMPPYQGQPSPYYPGYQQQTPKQLPSDNPRDDDGEGEQ